jgi:hypothetical protein
VLLLFGFLQHQKTPKTNSCTNLHHVVFFFFCCCWCFTAEEAQLAQKKLFFKGGEISNSLHPFLFTCYCCSWRSEEKLRVGCVCVCVLAVLGSRSEEKLGVGCVCVRWLCWGLDRRRIWKLCVCACVCMCVLVLGSPSSSCSSKQPPTTTTRKRRTLPQVTTRERESQKRGAETSRRT